VALVAVRKMWCTWHWCRQHYDLRGRVSCGCSMTRMHAGHKCLAVMLAFDLHLIVGPTMLLLLLVVRQCR
jgi:hypothetical protein